MAAPPASIHFAVDDGDLDDAELWAVIDSAAANPSRPRKPLAALKNSPNAFASSLVVKNPRPEGTRTSPDGVVVEEDRWGDRRPAKMARFVDPGPGDGRKMVVVRRSQQSPSVSFPPSPDTGRMSVQVQVQPVRTEVEISPQNLWLGERREGDGRHSLSGQFPSVSLFKQYQNAAMSVLEKSDYTMIGGSPFIKKSGWRKISFFFNLSFEIKDKNIEFDENRNVQRAEFVVRAFMQGGRFADGWGSCERREKRFSKPNHDIPSTAETRAKNKACQDLLGIGEYRPGISNMVR